MKIEDVIKTTRFDDERHKATINLMYTAYWYKSRVSAGLKEYNLTAEQFNVMRILKGKHPESMCIKDIADRMIENNSNVPRIVDRLLDKKWVIRTVSEKDRRETLIELTTKGIEILTKSGTAIKRVSDRIVGLTNEEAAELNRLLEKLRTNKEA